jgi:hypothetical protein
MLLCVHVLYIYNYIYVYMDMDMVMDTDIDIDIIRFDAKIRESYPLIHYFA